MSVRHFIVVVLCTFGVLRSESSESWKSSQVTRSCRSAVKSDVLRPTSKKAVQDLFSELTKMKLQGERGTLLPMPWALLTTNSCRMRALAVAYHLHTGKGVIPKRPFQSDIPFLLKPPKIEARMIHLYAKMKLRYSFVLPDKSELELEPFGSGRDVVNYDSDLDWIEHFAVAINVDGNITVIDPPTGRLLTVKEWVALYVKSPDRVKGPLSKEEMSMLNLHFYAGYPSSISAGYGFEPLFATQDLSPMNYSPEKIVADQFETAYLTLRSDHDLLRSFLRSYQIKDVELNQIQVRLVNRR